MSIQKHFPLVLVGMNEWTYFADAYGNDGNHSVINRRVLHCYTWAILNSTRTKTTTAVTENKDLKQFIAQGCILHAFANADLRLILESNHNYLQTTCLCRVNAIHSESNNKISEETRNQNGWWMHVNTWNMNGNVKLTFQS